MTRTERARAKAAKLEAAACRSAVRATSRRDPLGRAAIASGEVAARKFRKADLVRQAAADRESAATREKKTAKLAKNWWRGKQGAA